MQCRNEKQISDREFCFSRFSTNSAAGIRRTAEYDAAQLAPATSRHRFGIAQVSLGVPFSSQYKSTHEAHFDFDSPAETSQLLSTSRVRAVPAQAAQLFSTRAGQEESFIP